MPENINVAEVFMNFGIDLLRHLFSVAVILQHMASGSRYSVETNLKLTSIVDWVDGAVIGFFFISGFLLKDPHNFLAYAKKQAIRILIPFFLFSLLYTVILSILGKATLWNGLVATATLHGSGPHLYFLPFLLFITVTYTFFIDKVALKLRSPVEIASVFILILFCLIYPTSSSTGPDYKLLPFYYVSFILGMLYRTTLDKHYQPVGILVTIAIFLVIGISDPRFFDLAGILTLFTLVHQMARYLPSRRLPGSGGIYLLHTPIINYTISILLVHFAVIQEENIFISVLLTYVLCYLFTLLFIRFLPKYRYLLLE